MKKLFALVLSCTSAFAQAQLTVDTNITAQQMAQYLAGSGVLISNVQLNCARGAYGKFTGGAGTTLNINQGIVLTSGNALQLPGPSTVFASNQTNDNSDADLDAILAANPVQTESHDACVLEFDVKVNGDSLKFNYSFGSEEYPNYTCSQFTDLFAFFISGPNPQGGQYVKQNIALIPGTNLPVSINTVNSGTPSGSNSPSDCISLAYSNFFIGNSTIVYDGHTTVFEAKIATIPCQTYHLKLAIADAGDQILDSGVMLEAYSFSAANVKITPGIYNTPLFVNAVEGCAPSGFVISIDNVLTDTFTVYYSVGGTATSGIDYTALPGVLQFIPGDTSETLTIQPQLDFISEGLESVTLYLLNTCDMSPYDSATIYIQDSVVAAATSPDVTLCRGETTQITATGGLVYQWSPPAGLSATNIHNPYAKPLNTTKYYVTVSVGPCSDVDSILITVTDPLFSVNAGPDDTLCLNEASVIPLQVTGNQQPYTYKWIPATFLNDSTVQNPVTKPNTTTTYEVIVTGANGCTQRDTITYVIDGVGPVVKITPDKNFVCEGDTIQLQTQIFPMTCGLNTVGCNGQYSIEQIGNGNTQFGNSPFGNFGSGQRMQILYRASELQAAGISPCTITDLAFDLVSQGTFAPFDNFTIKMGCTDVDELDAWQTGLSTVYQGSYTLNGSGWNTISFSNPYDWDGYSNLIVEICYDFLNGFTNNDPVFSAGTSFNSVFFGSAFAEPGCDVSFGFSDFFRPNTRFIVCTEPPKNYTFSWTPVTNLITPDSLNPKVVLNQNTTYLLDVTDGECSGTGFVDLKIANYGIFAGNDTVVCLPGSLQLQTIITGDAPGVAVSCGANNTSCPSPQIYTLGGTTDPLPFLTPFDGMFIEDVRTQYLFRAADLTAMGLSAGTINSVALNITSKQSLQPFQNFNIKMACTELQSYAIMTDWPATQTVYTNNLLTTTSGWNTFNFTTNFDWDGTSNLILEICWDNPDFIFPMGTDGIELVTTNYNSTLYANSNMDVGCDLPVFLAFTDFSLPRVRFGYCEPPALVPQYTWQPPTGLSDPNIPNPVASPNQTTTYIVTADFPGGCVKRDTITLTPVQVNYSVTDDTTICHNGSANLAVNTDGTVNWQNTPGLSCYDCKNPVATPDSNTVYYFSVQANGCLVTDSVLVNVTTVDASVAFNDTLVDQGTAVQLFGSGSGGDGNYTYVWSPATALDNPNAQNPTATPLQPTVYLLTVNSAGCSDTASVNVRINIIESPIAMPNVFTPNGDGRNDLFYPVFSNDKLATVKEFRIYNRWGQMVHNSTSGWDGNFQSKEQPAGTYIYYIVIQRPLQKDEEIQGSFTLLR
ncbi:MAG: choice-of-anchor L domain-containing protein [Chitinophagales bacterium]|nr:choice-of-anchor L domain-containing protein [Chitinophagales bacterium]